MADVNTAELEGQEPKGTQRCQAAKASFGSRRGPPSPSALNILAPGCAGPVGMREFTQFSPISRLVGPIPFPSVGNERNQAEL